MVNFSNPFSRDTEGARRNITAYKVLSLISFLLQFITTLYYLNSDGHLGRHSVFHYVATPFTLNSVFVGIYWIFLWVLQVVYVWHLFRSDQEAVDSAAAVGSHFILYNVLHFAWVLLWVSGHTIVSEIVLVVNFLQLTSLYFRHHAAPRLVHLAVTALPLTFSFFMILWNGAVMVHSHHIVGRIIANIAVWGIAAFAGFFLLGFNDYYVGFATSFLAAGLGVGQFFTKVIALQWPFAFAVMAITFLASLAVAVPGVVPGRETSRRGERAPLLHEDA